MRIIRVIILTLLLSIVQYSFSQVKDPVKWAFNTRSISNNECEMVFTAHIDKGWHIYGMNLPENGPIALSFNFTDKANLLGKVGASTPPEKKHDSNFDMDILLHSGKAVFVQKIKCTAEEQIISGTVEFMACDNMQCLPPKEVDFKIVIPGTNIADEVPKTDAIGVAENPDTIQIENTAVTEQSGTSGAESTTSMWAFIFWAFLAGLAAILTPCVFPMIPMTVSFFMRGSENRSNAIIKGLFYGLSIIFIYTAIGVLVSLASVGAGAITQVSSHWLTNLIFGLLFLVFAISFFGAFEIVLPSGLVNSADKRAEKSGLLGIFFMALVTVLVSFSCTGPIVGALLVEAAGGVAMKPILGMLGFSLAFALPFTLFAIFPSALSALPKSGGWLNTVKVVLGFIILAFSMKYFSIIDQVYHLNIFSREIFIGIWLVIAVLLGIYLLGKIRFTHDSEVPHISVPRLFMSILSFVFAVYLFTGLLGAPLNGIASLLPPAKALLGKQVQQPVNNNGLCDTPKYPDLHLAYGLPGYFDYKQGMDCSKKMNKPVLLYFKGHACSNCKQMDAKVWADEQVQQTLHDKFIIIALYVDDRTRLPENEWVNSTIDGKTKKTLGQVNADRQLAKFNVNTQPYYVILDTAGNMLGKPVGTMLDIQQYKQWLDEGLQKFEARPQPMLILGIH